MGLAFKNYTDEEKALPPEQVLVAAGAPPRVVLDGARDRFVYAFPVSAPAQGGGASQDGTLLFYVSGKDLLGSLAGSARVSVDRLTLVGSSGIVLNFDAAETSAVQQALIASWSRTPASSSAIAPLTLADPDGTRHGFRVFSEPLNIGSI